jgi:hypothetical protein
MEQTFKITQGQEHKVVDRSLRKVLIILICMPVILFPFTASEGSIGIAVISALLSYLLFAGIYYGSRSVVILIYQNLIFKVNDYSLSREVLMDESKLNFFQQLIWERNNIDSIKDQGHSLLVKCKGSSMWDGKGLLNLPKEIEGFDKFENIIRQKTSIL